MKDFFHFWFVLPRMHEFITWLYVLLREFAISISVGRSRRGGRAFRFNLFLFLPNVVCVLGKNKKRIFTAIPNARISVDKKKNKNSLVALGLRTFFELETFLKSNFFS